MTLYIYLIFSQAFRWWLSAFALHLALVIWSTGIHDRRT